MREEHEAIGKIKIQSFGAHKHNSTAEASKMGFYYHPPQHISRHPHTRINLIISINKKKACDSHKFTSCVLYFYRDDDNFLNDFFALDASLMLKEIRVIIFVFTSTRIMFQL
jgi:hypothetical protein